MYTNGSVKGEINLQDKTLIKSRVDRRIEYVPVPVSKFGS
jgi:hypothetical protein